MKNKGFFHSLKNAMSGFFYTVRKERNMKVHVIAAVTAILMGLGFGISRMEFALLFTVIGLVLVCEMINTGVEMLADLISTVHHPKIKIIKDTAAGAVLLAAAVSLIVGYFIFFDKVIGFMKSL